MLLASIAVPFIAHTCLKTNHTDISILSTKAFCHHSVKNECHNSNVVSIEKQSNCCKSFSGTIEADTDLVVSSIVQFQTVIAVLPILKIFENVEKTYTYSPQKYTDVVASLKKQVPLQLMQQSFLC